MISQGLVDIADREDAAQLKCVPDFQSKQADIPGFGKKGWGVRRDYQEAAKLRSLPTIRPAPDPVSPFLGVAGSSLPVLMDEVHAIRDRVSADLVHLIIEVGDTANLPGIFGLTCAKCSARVFAHELGHNMGLSHDWHVSCSIPPLAAGHHLPSAVMEQAGGARPPPAAGVRIGGLFTAISMPKHGVAESDPKELRRVDRPSLVTIRSLHGSRPIPPAQPGRKGSSSSADLHCLLGHHRGVGAAARPLLLAITHFSSTTDFGVVLDSAWWETAGLGVICCIFLRPAASERFPCQHDGSDNRMSFPS